jgi:hypothetical protein
MHPLIKLYIKFILTLIFIIGFVYLVIDVNETRKEQLRKKGKLPPPRKMEKAKRYYDYKPENIDYDKPGLVDITETEMYKEYKKKYPNNNPNKETHKDWIWVTILLWIIIIYIRIKT